MLTSNNLHDPVQSLYKITHSTDTAIRKLHNDMPTKAETNVAVCTVVVS